MSANSNRNQNGEANAMVAVLIEVDVRGVEQDAGMTALREQIVPAIKSLPGFQSGTWLTGNEHGKGLSLTLWDSEAKAQTMVDRFGVGSNPAMMRLGRALRGPRRRRRGVRRV